MENKEKHPKKNGRFKKHVDYSHIKDNPYVEKWLENVNSEQTRLSILDKFCKFIDKTPTEIIMEHAKDIKQENPLDIKDIAKKQLKAFFGYLTGTDKKIWKNKLVDKKLFVDEIISWNSARQYVYSKLASFFKRNNVPIVWQKDEVPPEDKDKKDKNWRNGKERITPDEAKGFIKQIRDTFDNKRDRAILLCMVSSRMDGVDLFKLKVDDFNKGYTERICYIEGIRQKIERKGIRFQTFFNSEACDLINLYLKTRPDNAPDDAWLFVSKQKRNGKYGQIKSHFADNLKDVCNKLGINNITSKSFRRWFNTELKKYIPVEVVERMMGHKTAVSSKYQMLFDNEATFIKKYIDKYEQYTLLGNGGRKLGKVDERVKKVEDQNKQLIEQLAETNKSNKELENKINEMGKIVEVMEQYVFYKITEGKYPDIKLDKSTNLTNLIIKEFNKLVKNKK